MIRKILVFIFLAGALITLGYFVSRKPEAAALITNETRVETQIKIGSQAFVVELAVSDQQKIDGLSNRPSLPAGQGMLFVFKPSEEISFWMREMKFPLDIVWVRDGQVVGVEQNLPVPAEGTQPGDLTTYPSPGAVDYVLEVTAGQASQIKSGDRVEVSDSWLV